MKEYDFALIFKLGDPDVNPENLLDLLYESGCDDALIGVGKKGYISLNFIRESSSALEAVSSAINNVKDVIKDAEMVHVSPDLVGVKELASILGCSRQNIQRYVNQPTFPLPEYKGSQAVWRLAKVLTWFDENSSFEIKEELLDIAKLAMLLNCERESKEASLLLTMPS